MNTDLLHNLLNDLLRYHSGYQIIDNYIFDSNKSLYYKVVDYKQTYNNKNVISKVERTTKYLYSDAYDEDYMYITDTDNGFKCYYLQLVDRDEMREERLKKILE